MADTLTVFTPDQQWKADMSAWKNYLFFYASIGSEVTVYNLQETTNIWGNSTKGWVQQSALIMIENTYTGSEGSGIGTFMQSQQFSASSAELEQWAVGLISININPDSGDASASPGGAQLIINSVQATITVVVEGGQTMVGKVSASSFISDNSIWG
jgi:hypothetical protein